MTEYEFQCPRCRKAFTAWFDPSAEKRANCPTCNQRGERVFGATVGHIDWVNGGFHGEEFNLGLGKSFKSARERDNYAASLGLEKMG